MHIWHLRKCSSQCQGPVFRSYPRYSLADRTKTEPHEWRFNRWLQGTSEYRGGTACQIRIQNSYYKMLILSL